MADTYRVGAAEQLGGYARLLDVPMEIVRDGGELAAALARLRDRETVYVDTAGLGGDAATLASLRDLLAGAGEPVAVAAVLSAGASERALDGAWQKLATLGPRRCVVTKLDEGGGLGATCRWLRSTDMALAWLGTGQRVPGDLSAASGETLAHWLVAA
jgi:flagellar biosynthesis protein FlhF